MTRALTARAEIPHREWVELTIILDEEKVKSATWRAQGGYQLLKKAEFLSQHLVGETLESLSKKSNDNSPQGLLLQEVVDRLTGQFKIIADEVTCLCRSINKSVIDRMIVLGAHTPEKIKSWCSAGSGCGTCRPRVLKLINLRLRQQS